MEIRVCYNWSGPQAKCVVSGNRKINASRRLCRSSQRKIALYWYKQILEWWNIAAWKSWAIVNVSLLLFEPSA